MLSAKIKAESLSLSQIKDLFIGFRKVQTFFSFYRCQSCGLLYNPKYFSQQQLDLLYKEMPDNLLGEEKSVISKTQTGYVELISKWVSLAENYLELGPDIGLVTQEISKILNPKNIILIEPNEFVHNELRKNISNSTNLSIFKSIDEIEASNFNLTIGVHVFDHLLDPLSEIRLIHRLSAVNSYLCLVVHNEKSLLRKLLRKKWPPFCLQHPQLYNRKTIKNLLESAGWEIVAIKSTTNWFSLKHFFKLGLGILGLPQKLSLVIPNIEVPIRLGNIMCIVRKR